MSESKKSLNIQNELKAKEKIALISLGCPKNQVDAENMLMIIREAGYSLTPDLAEATAIVVNTCGFIQSAKEEAINAILEAADHKSSGPCRSLLVTGCLAQRYADEIKENLPEVDAILGTAHYKDVAACLDDLLFKSTAGNTEKQPSSSSEALVLCDHSGSAGIAHLRTDRIPSHSSYAYLKISEGCRHHCAYCAIPGIRGDMISREKEDILAEARELLARGIKEIILVAQDSTSYGLDIYGKMCFAELLDDLAELNFPRIRFLYAYSDGLTDEVLQVMNQHDNILKYIDLPIQHASDSVLKRMYRRDRRAGLKATFARVRAILPDVVIRTTVMVGFPGETEQEFLELLDFIDEIKFDHLGCFVFSPEEGTAAAEMDAAVDPAVAASRYDQVMRLQQSIHESKIKASVGETCTVLIESAADDGLFYVGRSEAQAPEIDTLCYVLFEHFEPQLGGLYPVRIIEAQGYDLIGVCESEFTE